MLLCGASAALGGAAGGGTAGKGPQNGKTPGGKPGNIPGTMREKSENDLVSFMIPEHRCFSKINAIRVAQIKAS